MQQASQQQTEVPGVLPLPQQQQPPAVAPQPFVAPPAGALPAPVVNNVKVTPKAIWMNDALGLIIPEVQEGPAPVPTGDVAISYLTDEESTYTHTNGESS